jgi:hypothetical protein
METEAAVEVGSEWYSKKRSRVFAVGASPQRPAGLEFGFILKHPVNEQHTSRNQACVSYALSSQLGNNQCVQPRDLSGTPEPRVR